MAYKFRGTTATAAPAAATTASRWVVGSAVQFVGYAANSDLTSWTFYDRIGDGSPDAIDVAYGKDASGNGIYCMTNDSSNKEVSISSADVTDGNAWTHIDLDSGANDQLVIAWAERSTGTAAGVWVTVGKQDSNKSYYRSLDGGANWSEISLNGITGHTTDRITALAADGTGKWMMAQNDRIYYSTDDAASFSLAHTLSGENITRITGMAFTNNSWVISYERSTASSKTFLRSCASSDVTTWSSEGGGTDGNGATLSNYGSSNIGRTTIVTYEGRILIVPHNRQRAGFADISGTTISNFETVNMNISSANKNMRDAATDGTTWLICGQDGYIWKSADNAESWAIAATSIRNSTDDMQCVTGDVYLPQ